MALELDQQSQGSPLPEYSARYRQQVQNAAAQLNDLASLISLGVFVELIPPLHQSGHITILSVANGEEKALIAISSVPGETKVCATQLTRDRGQDGTIFFPLIKITYPPGGETRELKLELIMHDSHGSTNTYLLTPEDLQRYPGFFKYLIELNEATTFAIATDSNLIGRDQLLNFRDDLRCFIYVARDTTRRLDPA